VSDGAAPTAARVSATVGSLPPPSRRPALTIRAGTNAGRTRRYSKSRTTWPGACSRRSSSASRASSGPWMLGFPALLAFEPARRCPFGLGAVDDVLLLGPGRHPVGRQFRPNRHEGQLARPAGLELDSLHARFAGEIRADWNRPGQPQAPAREHAAAPRDRRQERAVRRMTVGADLPGFGVFQQREPVPQGRQRVPWIQARRGRADQVRERRGAPWIDPACHRHRARPPARQRLAQFRHTPIIPRGKDDRTRRVTWDVMDKGASSRATR
jgi:hypothetical protein